MVCCDGVCVCGRFRVCLEFGDMSCRGEVHGELLCVPGGCVSCGHC